MYKNQLQELAQRSCFNLPAYTSIREGPDHAPRFKATVNFNGEVFECPHYCSTLRQAEHSAAEVALNSLSHRGPSHSLAARILDETGVYKNLLQEIAQRVGAPLPQYTTFRSGLGHQPVFTGIVELAGISFTGDAAKNKKQAEKNAAMAAWSSLKQLAKEEGSSSSEPENNDELEQITIARALLNYRMKERMTLASSSSAPIPFQKKFPSQNPRPTSPQPPPATTSRILPLIYPKPTRNRPMVTDRLQYPRSISTTPNDRYAPPRPTTDRFAPPRQPNVLDLWAHQPQKLHAPYIPMQPFGQPCHSSVQPVTIRHAVPCYAAPPPRPQPMVVVPPHPVRAPHIGRNVIPVTIRQAVPVFSAPPPASVRKVEPPTLQKDPAESKIDSSEAKKDSCAEVKQEETTLIAVIPSQVQEQNPTVKNEESKVGESMEQLKI
ncbi:Double-stranded RNA-binding protein 2 [Linum perenne]